jgi:N-acetylglucosaminyldiphosphoundecaprenol N-acetyl-beta-D-mannosaminyltransferase
MRGYKNIRRVYGPDLMQNICGISAKKGYKNYLFGSSNKVLEKLKDKLTKKYPGLIISGSYSPSYGELSQKESEAIIANINNSDSDVLWVGLGSPKQDLWMYRNRDKINVPVMLGVGAAFDFLSGTKPQAPVWMRNSGFEWFFRLITEPKRLWRRYIIDSSLFIWYLCVESLVSSLKKKANNTAT